MPETYLNQFSGAAEYYDRFRPGIPPSVAKFLVDLIPRDDPGCLFDVGCGTGQIVQALLPRCREILALDPEPDMLRVAQRKFQHLDPSQKRINWSLSTIEDFAPPPVWQASLVTFCRSFHWTSRVGTLKKLDPLVKPTGAVAIMTDRSFWRGDSEWQKVVVDTVKEFLGERRRAGVGHHPQNYRPWSEELRETPFSDVIEEALFPYTHQWKIESIIGYLHSTSFAAQHLFGSRLKEFEEALRKRLGEPSAKESYLEENEFSVTVGRRPAG